MVRCDGLVGDGDDDGEADRQGTALGVETQLPALIYSIVHFSVSVTRSTRTWTLVPDRPFAWLPVPLPVPDAGPVAERVQHVRSMSEGSGGVGAVGAECSECGAGAVVQRVAVGQQ